MLKEEFEKLAGTKIDQKSYDLIEFVYQWHPCVRDKHHIVELYRLGGLWLIKDMEARAVDAADTNEKQRDLQKQIEKLYDRICNLQHEMDSRWEE